MSEVPLFRDPSVPVAARVEDLLARMTLEEKIDQLHQCGIGDANPNNIAERPDEFRPTYGSFILNGLTADLTTRNALQRMCVEQSRLGIPAIFGCDVIHGYRAIAPIPLAQACTWDPELVRRACEATAEMARAHGVDWTFAPMVDHCTDPRWGRVAETFGESPFASSRFAEASVRGYQEAPVPIAACLKHYVGYGASEGGRDYSATEISPQALWERHLPPFEAGVRAGALSVMSAFNDLNGVPTSAHRQTLTEILRERWNFEGLVVSDWNAVLQLMNQGYAATEQEAAALALTAGVDLNMADGFYRRHLAALVRSGSVPLAVVDEAVRRVLRVKFAIGLFERPLVEPTALTGAAPTTPQLSLCEEVALRSLVLLKNDGDTLPLPATVRRVALIGPLALDRGALLGSWAQQGRGDETPSIAEELRARLPAGVELTVVAGCAIEGGGREGFAAALAAARAADFVVLCLGEQWSMSGENASRSSIRLPGWQEELGLELAALGKPTALVLVTGRPVELHRLEPCVGAILAAWQPGSRAGAAIARVLLGEANPSGRLAITWPRTTGQIPLYHNMRPRARRDPEGFYQDVPTTPHYAFGHGLSYTTFGYGEIRLSRASVREGETVVAEVTVTNTGSRAGREHVLWFIRDPAASVTRPLRDLKHFESAELAPGESRVFRWEIEPRRDFAFPDAAGRSVLEPGEIQVFVGDRAAALTVLA
ncbi:MAG: glycoside hydrolase family 3 C-terminal domain-containing protein [Opitutae bacterium]|nr:glycoside hydrolase family 3 C-terminal domain-containing protein [Opitutae bacterium]